VDKLAKAFSTVLPPDLSLYEASAVSDDFHPRYDAKGKEYVYIVYNAEVTNPFYTDRAWQIQRKITDDGLSRMQKAAKHFIGKNDFSAFMSAGSDVSDTVRTVFDFSVKRNGDEVIFSVSADGFLYNMVRIMVGTLVQVAFKNIEPDEIENIIKGKQRYGAGMTAPPEGLYLNRVFY
jgi:tRNA pseudouridine38-40 synthase